MAGDRHSCFDTLTGYDPEAEDPLMRALNELDAALDERGAVIRELKEKSDPPPPPLPPTPAIPAAA